MLGFLFSIVFTATLFSIIVGRTLYDMITFKKDATWKAQKKWWKELPKSRRDALFRQPHHH